MSVACFLLSSSCPRVVPVVTSAYCSVYVDSYSPGCCQEDLCEHVSGGGPEWVEEASSFSLGVSEITKKMITVLEKKKREPSKNYIHEGFLHKQTPPLNYF